MAPYAQSITGAATMSVFTMGIDTNSEYSNVVTSSSGTGFFSDFVFGVFVLDIFGVFVFGVFVPGAGGGGDVFVFGVFVPGAGVVGGGGGVFVLFGAGVVVSGGGAGVEDFTVPDQKAPPRVSSHVLTNIDNISTTAMRPMPTLRFFIFIKRDAIA